MGSRLSSCIAGTRYGAIGLPIPLSWCGSARAGSLRLCGASLAGESGRRTLVMYDCVGLVKAFFTALGRKKCVRRRRCGEAGVKGAFFAFISTLDTGLSTSTIGWGQISVFF